MCVAGFCSEIEDAVSDATETEDLGLGEVTPIDVTESELDLEVGDGPDPGSFGAACEDDIECDSRYCVDTGDDSVCTQLCRDACPDGWECRLLSNTGADAVRICVPERNILCDPCDLDIDCGLFGAFCIEQLDGSFCATDCSATEECPGDYSCRTRILSDGGPDGEELEVRLCEPDLSVCADCFDQDGDDYGIGLGCLGEDCNDGDDKIYPDAPERCNGLDDNCNLIPDETFDLTSSLTHCGECDSPCFSLLGESVACIESECIVTGCLDRTEDCNEGSDDGCEINFDDPTTCGDICYETVDCTALRRVDAVSCSEGACGIDECLSGYDHCSDDVLDGCEVDLNAVDTCGTGCDDLVDCESDPPAVLEVGCVEGVCTIEKCNPGFENCQTEDPLDGCETAIWAAANCGLTCEGTVNCLELPNVAVVDCAEGSCAIERCEAGWGNCNADPGCETQLWLDDGCRLTCDDVAADCSDPQHIEEASCVEGVCEIDECETGWESCSGGHGDGCETQIHAATRCGTSCDGPFVNCTTGTQVSDGVCNALGQCEVTDCNQGYLDCTGGHGDGCEVSMLADNSCGSTCFDLQDCRTPSHGEGECAIQFDEGVVSGLCEVTDCEAGWDDCTDAPGCETDIYSDNGCGSACENTVDCDGLFRVTNGTCTTGVCGSFVCEDGYDDCTNAAGCETDIWDDNDCGTGCQGRTDCDTLTNTEEGVCNAGTCEVYLCESGWDQCGDDVGCETALTTPQSCGSSCDDVTACEFPHAEDLCTDGDCVQGECDTNYYDIDPDEAGCEYYCTGDPDDEDIPDPSFIDSNCDGIDGDIDRAFFVATDGDDDDAGTRGAPFQTVQAALDAAEESGSRDHVYVARGTYTSETISLPNGVSLFGQYNADNWSSPLLVDRASNNTTTISSTETYAIRVLNYDSTGYLAGFTIQSDDGPEPGYSSVAIELYNVSGDFIVEDNEIRAGAGEAAEHRSQATGGDDGVNGADGDDGCDGCNNSSGPNDGRGGSGSTAGCNSGGNGGRGGYDNNWGSSGSTGYPVVDGVRVGGSGGGGGHNPGDCPDNGGTGNNGGAGDGGSRGTNGNHSSTHNKGSLFFFFGRFFWVTGVGDAGGPGGDGAGGGGGGGGGGGTTYLGACWEDRGGGGGGGGSGGCGGNGGDAGRGGGGSFAIMAFLSDGATVRNNVLVTAGGGRGGDGGAGGIGGDGGHYPTNSARGGKGGSGQDDSGSGGWGGPGGDGGRGGGGTGGPGGPSIGIWRYQSSGLTSSGNNTDGLGPAGLGGDGGTNGSVYAEDGKTGLRYSDYSY